MSLASNPPAKICFLTSNINSRLLLKNALPLIMLSSYGVINGITFLILKTECGSSVFSARNVLRFF